MAPIIFALIIVCFSVVSFGLGVSYERTKRSKPVGWIEINTKDITKETMIIHFTEDFLDRSQVTMDVVSDYSRGEDS